MMYFDRQLCSLLAMTVVAAMIILVTWSSVFGKRKEMLLHSQTFSAHRDAAYKTIEDQKFMEANYHLFDQLMDKKTNAGYHRKDWIELLSLAKNELNIAQISFDIFPEVQLFSDIDRKSIEVGYEVIDVKLGLLHDGELLSFLAYINEQLTISYEITRMEITRVNRKNNNRLANQMQVNITVNFSIKWYSIANSGAFRAPV